MDDPKAMLEAHDKPAATVGCSSSEPHSSNGVRKGERRGGRTKGTPNKISADVRSAILAALEAVGGQAYLERIAKEHPAVFCALLGKILPLTLAGDPDGAPIVVKVVTGVPRDA